MGGMKKWMLGAAMVAGVMAMGTVPANAAQFGIYVNGGPAAYIPPCPGPGYIWVDGYWANGYWVPGYWEFAGYGPRVVIRGGFGWHGRDFDHRGFYRHDFDRRGFDDRHFDRDHFRR